MILYEGPHHGYGIITQFKKRLKRSITPSIVYPFLTLLEDEGYVHHTIQPIGKKKRKIYTLTEEGRQFSERLFKRFATLISTALEPKLSVCLHCGCKIFEGGHREVIRGKESTFCCEHCAHSYKQELAES
jgi:DNA-binding MarR family transcriptional regulator